LYILLLKNKIRSRKLEISFAVINRKVKYNDNKYAHFLQTNIEKYSIAARKRTVRNIYYNAMGNLYTDNRSPSMTDKNYSLVLKTFSSVRKIL